MSFQLTVEPVARLIDELNKLPGIGPKSAARLTFYLLRSPKEQTQALAEAILDMKERKHKQVDPKLGMLHLRYASATWNSRSES